MISSQTISQGFIGAWNVSHSTAPLAATGALVRLVPKKVHCRMFGRFPANDRNNCFSQRICSTGGAFRDSNDQNTDQDPKSGPRLGVPHRFPCFPRRDSPSSHLVNYISRTWIYLGYFSAVLCKILYTLVGWNNRLISRTIRGDSMHHTGCSWRWI